MVKRKMNRVSKSRKKKVVRKRRRLITRRQRGGFELPIEDIGFIVARCVKEKKHNTLYKECYNAIRKFHPNVKIIFIDDNSNKDALEDHPMTNVEIIQSEYPAAGEYLPYYYYLQRKPFKKAVLLQDSMILNSEIPFDSVDKYKFLFYYNPIEEDQNPTPLLEKSKIPTELISLYNSKTWVGCWGSTMIITYDFLRQLEDKIGITSWKDIINTRAMRIQLETAIALACIYMNNDNPPITNSLCGNCYDQQVMREYNSVGKKFDIATYLHDKDKIKDKVIKVFNGR